MKKLIITLMNTLHIFNIIFSIILLCLTKLGKDYFKYIYTISLAQTTNYRFNTFIFIMLCAMLFCVIDFVMFFVCIVKGIRNSQFTYMRHKLSYWLIMLVISIASFWICFVHYFMWIT